MGQCQILLRCIAVVMLASSTSIFAATTYDGTEGVYSNVFSSNSQQACTDCHNSALVGATDRNSAPDEVNFNTWAWVNSIPSYYSGDTNYRNSLRAKTRAADDDTMPPTGTPLNASEQSLLIAWASSGYVRYAAPSVTTGNESSVTKYTARLNATVQENGINTSFYFQYSTSLATVNGNGGTTVAVSSGSGNPSGTGGGNSNKSVWVDLSGLSCGTTYYYRAHSYSNGTYSAQHGSTGSLATSSCPTITQGTSVSVSMDEDSSPTSFSRTLNATGGTAGELTWSISSAASNGTATASGTGTSKAIGYTPDANYFGSDSFVVRVSDGTTSDTITVNVTISSRNDAPVITQGTSTSVSMSEDGSPTPFSLTLNATDVDHTGSSLTWSISSAASNGVATASGTGNSKTIGYTPTSNYFGSDSFQVRVQDASGSSDTITVNVTISSQNDVPVITQGATTSVVMSEDSSPTPFSLLLNATDVESAGSQLTWNIQSAASNGTASASGTGASKSISYTPTGNYFGADSFVVRVSDSGGASATITVNVTVQAVNDAPVISSSPATSATEDVQYSYTVTVNDPDDSGFGSELTLSLVSAKDNNNVDLTGVSFNTSTGLLTWTPQNGLASPAAFQIQVEDGDEDGSGPTVLSWNVSVDSVNDGPSITTTAPNTATEDTPYSYAVGVNDPDDANNGIDLTWQLSNAPTGMSISSTGLISWTPLEGVTTSGVVTVSVQDGLENGAVAATENFTVAVTAVNDPPTITAVPSANATEDTLYQFSVLVSDPDDTSWTFSLQNAPTGMSINTSTGQISWTPLEGVTSSGTVTVNAADSGADGASPDSTTFSISVTQVNDQPSITSSPVLTATEDVLYQYQLTVVDPDIPADVISYDFVARPDTSMMVSSSGLIQWTPSEVGPKQTTPYTVNVTPRIRDGLEDGVTAVSQPYGITVTPVNDAPAITTSGTFAAEELSSFLLQVVAVDPDDFNDGTGLTWNLNTPPAGMTISTTGVISWTPPEESAGATGVAFVDYDISVTVADGGEDGTASDTSLITVRVNKLDGDGDLVADYNDNCPLDKNLDQIDTDGQDGGDVCDPDDDGDGIEDVAEIANGLDPKDSADALLDADGDGLSNLDEFNDCVGTAAYPECTGISVDSVAPTISLVTPLTVPSTAYLTALTPVVSADDGNDGATLVALVERDGDAVNIAAGTEFLLRPGRHTFVWQSSDSENNTAQRTQTIDVLPRVFVSNSQTVAEGQTGAVVFRLNGDAPTYPVTVSYSLAGSANSADVAALSGSAEIASGREFSVPIQVLNDGVGEGDEVLNIVIDSVSANAVLGTATTHALLIVERQVAPQVALSVTQNGRSGQTIFANDGSVSITATASDPNGDALSYSWSADDLDVIFSGSNENQLIDPSALSGLYQIMVDVSDGTDVTQQSVAVNVISGVPAVLGVTDLDGDQIDDASEGYSDSDGDGVPDYLDAIDEAFSLPLAANQNGVDLKNLVQTEEGFSLKLGSAGVSSGASGAKVASTTLPRDTLYGAVGAMFDFEVHGLNEAQRSASLVLPLSNPILPSARYRKFDGAQWVFFIEDANNTISSAARIDGACPSVSSTTWQTGLRAGATCVRLRMNDGGPNDADGLVNGVIRDPGGVAVQRNVPEETSVPSSGPNNGAGSFGWLLFASFMLLSGRRRKNL